ncbi:MAG TPA: triple tyrosine motif-containing protein [Candidatus Sulfotelmatobacter sp.]|nr:triple tyrosine motif-containing protein [Candidatus Sulfotelmatobacter sp.]
MAYVWAFSLSCAAQGLEPETKLTQYAHKVWDIGDAGLLGTPQSITQTRDGYIWVSTSNGLFRFDGVRFAQWESQPGEALPSSSLWHLYGARNGSLYIGTDRGLARITADHIQNYPNSPRWPGPFVEDADGVVWMGISGAHSASSPLCSIGKTKLECLGTQDGFGCGRGLSNTVATDGSIWVGTDEGTCRWKKGDMPEKQEIPSLVKQNGLGGVTSLASTSDGMLWAGTQHNGEGEGLLQFAHGAWNTYVTPSVDGRQLSVSALLAAKDDVLWIGTTDKGLYRLSNGVLDHIDVEDGLSGRRVLSILEDREGGLWAVTPMGVDFFRDYATLSFTSNEGTLDTRARAVAVDGTNSIYLGGDVLIRMRHGKIDQIKDQNANPLQDIQFLFADSMGNLWIGAGRRLFILKNGKSISEISSFSKEGAEIVVYIAEDRNHDIWVSSEDLKTRNSFLVKIHDEKITGKYGGGTLVGNQMINALAPDPEGGIWAGGALHGLFRFRDGQFERVMANEFDDRVENLLQERGGALWLVTPNGFIRFADGTMKKLNAASGLPCDGAVNIQDDGEGSKWFYMHCGIMSVSEKSTSRWWNDSRMRISGRFFGPLEGARPNLFNGSPAQTSDGQLWSANSYDFQVVNRNHLPFNPIPPPVIIEMVSADGIEHMPDRDLQLIPHTREVEVDYTGLSFRIPEQVRFRYRLVGHDKIWVEAGTRRQAFYNDLKPGRYIFQVIASNNDGVWNNDGAKIVFNVMPAWYQTLLFRVLAILLGMGLVIAAYYLRLSRYAASLKIRFDERLDERTRLARDLHDTLLQTIQGSKLVADNARDHADNPRSTVRALDRLSEWLDRAIAEGRDALEALRSSASESDSLTSALRRAADDCSFDCQIKVTVVTLGMDRELHPIARDEVYRIGYEAIRNACMHSGGTELVVEVRCRKRSFRLEIRDNGRGMDRGLLQSGKTGHFGLTGMRERALSLGGTLNITSEPDRGTTVSLSVPGSAVYLNRPWRPHLWIRDAIRQIQHYFSSPN